MHPLGQLAHTRHSDCVPDPDGSLKKTARSKIRHYHNVNLNRPDPIAFLPLSVDTSTSVRLYDDFIRLFFLDTSVRLYGDFIRLIFLHAHRETSVLTNEPPEESDQFRFLRTVCFANLKGTVGLIMAKASAMRISIPLDLSPWSFIPLPRFIRSCRPTPLVSPSLVLLPPCSA